MSGRLVAAAACSALTLLVGPVVNGDPSKPKLGQHAVSVQQSHAYLQSHSAPDYWALSAYYQAQYTPSACSVASIAMVLNALRGLPGFDDIRLVTQKSLLRAVGIQQWSAQTMEHGSGVTWQELERYLRASLQAFHLDANLDVWRPQDAGPASLTAMRTLLIQNENTDQDLVLVYFNQGILTGSWDGPHISPVGAYDADYRRVLIMDVDREWYVPYWVADEKLLEAMLRPAPSNFGALAGQRGGLIRAALKSPRHLDRRLPSPGPEH